MKWRYKPTIILILIIGIHIFLLSRLIFFPYPELFIYSYLTKAGLLPYAQIFDQHFPGIMFFPINLATLGLNTVHAARYLHLFCIGFTQILIYILSKKIFKSSTKPLLVNMLYLVWQPFFEGYVLWIDTFIPLFLIPSLYFLIDWQQKKRFISLFWVGLFLGLALLFKQVIGPLIVAVFILIWVTKKRVYDIIYFLAGLFIPVSVLIGYISYIGVWKEFIYWTVVFNLTVFSQMGRKFPNIAEILKSGLIFGSAIIAIPIIYFGKYRKYNLVLAMYLMGSLMFSYARFDYIHLQPAIPFALVLITSLFYSDYYKLKIFFGALIIIGALYLIPHFYRLNIGNRTLFFGDFERRLSNAVLSYASQNDTIFAIGTTPHIYELTNTLPPGRIFVFQFPWFMKVSEDKILQGLEKNPPIVVIRDETTTTGGINLMNNMEFINRYIEQNYTTINKVDSTDIMIKK